MEKINDLRAICLALALSNGDLRERLRRDHSSKYSAEAWMYIAQQASQCLVAVMCGVVSNYIYATRKKATQFTVHDLFTREVVDGIVEYKRAVERLRKHRAQSDESQRLVDVLVMENSNVLKVLEAEDLASINLLELLHEINSLPRSELRRRASEFDDR